jgi:intein/homing endonuclease
MSTPIVQRASSKLFLHKKQMEVYRSKHRFKVVVAGRRWGKTQLAKTSILKYGRIRNRLIWYVAPSYRMAKQIMWPELLAATPRAWVKKINETTLSMILVNGTRIELKGADDPDSLRGVGVHYLVMDEVQDIDPEAWTRVLRPTLASTGGHALFIGCVRGDTRVLTRSGIRQIESFSSAKEPKTLESLHCDLYGINRSFHTANGFWNNGVVKTKKIKSHMGFEIEASEPHPMMVMKQDGNPVWKRSDQIEVGDRIAIARGMEQWGNKDPLDGLEEHMNEWHKQFEGKKGPKPKRLAA